MAWFRRRDADRKPAEGTMRHRLAGLAIALGVVLLVLALRALPGPASLARALELKSLDLRFRLRAPIPEDPRVVNIDIDDASLRNLRLNFPLLLNHCQSRCPNHCPRSSRSRCPSHGRNSQRKIRQMTDPCQCPGQGGKT